MLRVLYIDGGTISKRFTTKEDVAKSSENLLPSSQASFDLIYETMQMSHCLGTAPFSNCMHSRNYPTGAVCAVTLLIYSVPHALFI